MTDYLDEIQARADAASDGPWEAYDERAELADASPLWVLGRMDVRGDWMHDVADVGRDPQDRANAEFIAHARTDVPRLVAFAKAVLALHSPDEWGDCPACHLRADQEAYDIDDCPVRQLAVKHLGGDR